MNRSLKVFLHASLIIIVILSYAFFAKTSANVKPFSKIAHGHYQYLTESFLQGHTYFNIAPPKGLLALKNPYHFQENVKILFPDGESLHGKLHDASLYQNKFYLYFGPLPVIVFYIPCKLLTGFYPPDYFAVFLFLSLGFVICYGLLNQIQKDFFPNIKPEMMMLCGLVLGFANNGPFLLMRPSFYEVAIASAFCFLSAAVFFLYRLFRYRFKLGDIFLFCTLLGLSVGGRPHFAIIAIVIIPILLLYIFKYDRLTLSKIFAFSPIVIIGILLLVYNQLRFHSMFEFGQNYQLTYDSHGLLAKLKFFDFNNMIFNFKEGFYNYFLRPFLTINTFPYVFFPDLFVERISHDNIYEGSFGIFKTTPFVILVMLLPFQWVFNRKKMSEGSLFNFIFCLSLISSIIILFLISLNSSTQRYILDFSAYLIMLAILSLWICERYLHENLYRFIKIFFVISGIFSIYVGIIQAKALTFTGLYLRHLDLSFVNYFVFFTFLTIEMLLIYIFVRRPSGIRT